MILPLASDDTIFLLIDNDLTKKQKAEVRKLNGLAWQRELSTALEGLEAEFKRWREGELDPFELNDLIHRFHDDTSRDLFKTYSYRPDCLQLCNAAARGVISGNELSEGLRDLLTETILDIRRRYEESLRKDS